MIARTCAADRRGLTLIELILALTVLAIGGTLVSGALSTGLHAWQSGLRSGREELVARILLERLATQLRASVDSPARRSNEDAVAFDAGEDHLRFVTLAAAGAAPVQVFYGLRDGGEGRRLVYREHPWPDKEFFGESRPRREERLAEVTGFAVKAFKRKEESGSGTSAPEVSDEEWSPTDQALPARVSVEILVSAEGEPEARRYQVTIAIPAQGAR